VIDGIHQSSLNMGLKCAESFRRRYLMGEIIPPGIALLRGTGTHKAAEINHQQKIETGQDLPLDDLKDAARDKYVKRAKESGVYLIKEDLSAKDRLLNDGLNDTVRCVETYHKDIAPTIQPIAVEEKIGPIDVGLELPVFLRIDYWEKDNLIRDLKTAAKKWTAGRINTEIQPVLYSLGYLLEFNVNPRFRYDITIARRGKDGKPTSTGTDTQEMQATNQDYSALYEKMKAFIKMLKLGNFPPCNSNNWWCSERYCGYWHTCAYCGNASVTKWI